MSKVEELQERIVEVMMYEHDCDARAELDSLIAAAREEGAEQGRERIRKTARHGIGVVDGRGEAMTYKELEELWRNLRYATPSEWICSISNRLDAARAEGAGQTVQKILANAEFIPDGQCTDGFAECDEYVFPASLLSPAPKEDK